MPHDPLTLFIHIGTGKTGTTALQTHLAAHRGGLARLGIDYLAAGGGSEGRGHDDVAKLCIGQEQAFMKRRGDPAEIERAFIEELERTPHQTVLLSAEHFELADPRRLRQMLASLKRPFRAKILYAVRSPDELLEAEYNQLVKIGWYSGTIHDYAETHFQGGNYLAVAEAWEAAFGPGAITAWIYNAAAPDALGEIAAHMGRPDITAELPLLPASTNTSIGIQALTAIRLWRALGGAKNDPHLATLRKGLPGEDPPALFFDVAEAEAFRARYAQAMRSFSARYLGQDLEDLGGRRYSDSARDRIRAKIKALHLG